MAYIKNVWKNSDETGKIAINKTNLNHIEDGIAANDISIGNISELETTATDLVEAVNEVNNKISCNYSTEEVDTGKKWIDGKTIYRKTIVGTTAITNASTINHEISNIGTHRVVAEAEFWYNGNMWNQTYTNNTSYVFVEAINDINIVFDVGSGFSNLFIPTVTIEYTKTS